MLKLCPVLLISAESSVKTGKFADNMLLISAESSVKTVPCVTDICGE